MGDEGFGFGFGNVTTEGLLKVDELVAFALDAVDPKVFGPHTEWTKLLGEPDFGDGFAFTGFYPGPQGKAIAVEAADDLAGEQALLFEKDKEQADVKEEGRGRTVGLGLGF